MAENQADKSLEVAMGFFIKAQQVAKDGNYDYAIELYLEGLQYSPDALAEGHIELHNLALLRQVKGGKKPTIKEKFKRAMGKTPLDKMINAEFLFAKDPDNLGYAEAFLKSAVAGDYQKAAGWIADIVFQANNAANKPSLRLYLLLKDSYSKLKLYDRAMTACQRASKLKPQDAELADEFKRLSAELTVSKGNYDNAGDFRKSMKNRESQEKLQSQENLIKTSDYLSEALSDARDAYRREPGLAQNIHNLAKTLVETKKAENQNEALDILEKAYQNTMDFTFIEQTGQIKIKQIKDRFRKIKGALEADSASQSLRAQVAEVSAELNDAEMDHFKRCMGNYPTNLQFKYEYGVRLMRNKQFDQAIVMLQEAQRDPRRKISAMGKIGLCFFNKGWFSDASDVFSEAISACEIKDSGIAKELRYNLARAHEEQGDGEKALDIYRRLAQLDFGYRDVRQRVDGLRKKTNGPA